MFDHILSLMQLMISIYQIKDLFNCYNTEFFFALSKNVALFSYIILVKTFKDIYFLIRAYTIPNLSTETTTKTYF